MKLSREKKPRNRCREGSRHPMEKRRREPLAAAFFRKTEELFGPQIQLLGDRELLIEGCRSVEACDENLIRLRLPGLLLMVLAQPLQPFRWPPWLPMVRELLEFRRLLRSVVLTS